MTRSRRIRVMHVVPDLRVGGAERHVTQLMPNLDSSKFEAAVVCIGEEGELFADIVGSHVRAVALHRNKRQALRALGDLMREMRAFAPDVVITRGFNAELLGRVAARLTRVPYNIVWVHNYGMAEPRTSLRRISDRVLDRFTSAYFGLVQAQVDYMVSDLKYPRDKIRVIHNGVDPAAFEWTDDRHAVADLGISKSDKVIGIFAMFRPEKDHQTFLRAARLVADRIPNAKFLVVGDGPMRPEIESLISELELTDRVVLTGSRSDVPDLLRSVDVFVLSSRTVECFPISLLEAMAAGRPAVCTAVGGVPEMIEEPATGFLVPPRDPEALADRLVEILSDPDLARRMGRAARARVESSFSLRASVSATEIAIQTMVGNDVKRDRPVRLSAVLDVASVGGAEILLLNLFKHFDTDVVEPRLVCLRAPGPLADDFRNASFDVEILERSGRFDLRTVPRLVRSFRAAGTDAVLVTHHQRASLALGRIAARLAGVPASVVAAHDMDLTSIGKRVLPRWAVSTLALSDALVLLSRGQGDYLRREEGVGQRLRATTQEVVIPNGIQLSAPPTAADRQRARALLGVADSEFVVGVVARLSAQKAHEVLFEAIAATAGDVPQICLVVIGGGDRDGELRQLAQHLGIGSRTKFLGVRRDVEDLLPGLDVACLSSVHEGVPITLIEAMAAGIPVIATDCGSVRDIVRDGEQGFVVPVGDVANFADRLRVLADDEALRTQLGKSGRTRVETEFRIENTARRYEELLTDVLARKG
ncbi:glycosyltransferase [Mycobacterium neglectum]|uniref:glycosyltransferase n=1 Tax=Mycobacterium neglectum TaxID=242737 RepID=UPI001FEC316A|nr:glycosyltransferase [Mycobacterium neglectum]